MAQHEINGKAIYLDTENSFRPERIEAIAKARGFDSENILKSIHILKAFNSSSQEQIIKKKVRAFIEKEGKNIKLLVVDSVIAHYRAEFSGRALLSESD
jgi:DNA repair protein RadA